MPNHPNDPKGNKKKLHIGNNFATIVYNDSGEEFNFQIIKVPFNFESIGFSIDINRYFLIFQLELWFRASSISPLSSSNRWNTVRTRSRYRSRTTLTILSAIPTTKSFPITACQFWPANWLFIATWVIQTFYNNCHNYHIFRVRQTLYYC